MPRTPRVGLGAKCVSGQTVRPRACPEERAHLTRATWQCCGHACPNSARTSVNHGGISPPLASAVQGGAESSGGRSRRRCPSAPRPCLLQTWPRQRAGAASLPSASSSQCTLFAIIFKMSLFRRSAEPAPALSLLAASVAPRRLRGSPMSSS